jgi:cephalosporin-C deacetylase-like acetyl esterase
MKQILITTIAAMLLVTLSQSLGFAAESLPLPKETPWDLAALKKVPAFEWIRQKSGVHSMLYAGEKYRGKPTRVFAYYASPKTLGKGGDDNVPGIVLVHGGGGTAFANWVELWAKRGYAAIAMDLAGCGEGRQRLPDGGPNQSHTEMFSTIDEPLENQWSYHAVANVVRGHSLLRSFKEVDADRIALTGIRLATGYGLYVAERLLGHSDPSVTADYYADLCEVPKVVVRKS